MNVEITFRHMEHTPALDSVIRDKSEKFIKWFGPSTDVRWTCWREGINHCAEVFIYSGANEFFAKGRTDDLYKTFDLIINKIKNQFNK